MGDGNNMIVELTDTNYDEVLSKGKIVLDFYANWCGVCKMLMPKVMELSQQKQDYLFYKVNADEHNDLVNKYQIRNLPTFIVLENGKEVKKGGFDILGTL